MTHTFSAVEARQKFGEMLSRVEFQHEEIVIKRAGKKVARLVPLAEPVSSLQSKLDFRTAAGLGQEIWQRIDVNEYLHQERGEWD
jgi:prevent-host-death family protein